MGNRRTERDPLLLAARELSRVSRCSRAETDPFEQLACTGFALALLDALRAELQAHELLCGQLGRQRSCVVLVEVADRARPVAGAATGAERAQVVPERAHRSGRGQVEPGEDPQERRLARSARAEHGQDLPVGDAQRQALERGRVALGSRMDAEHVASLDRRAHAPPSP